MLKLRKVSAGYNSVDVIHEISAEVCENVCIVGPNGCGKTTLLKSIAGIIPSKGEILIEDKPLTSMKRIDIAKKIAMLSQQPSIYFAYSVFDVVMMGRYVHLKDRISNNPSKTDKDAVEASLQAVNLWDSKDKDITKLSGGQLQRVFLARTLAQEPKIILLDEPTNHLDLKCQIEITQYLKAWSKSGNRIVIGVLHDINLAMMLAERMIVMKEGEVQADGAVEQIITSKLLDNAYDMDVASHMRLSLKRWQNDGDNKKPSK